MNEKSDGDEHLALLKSALLRDYPGWNHNGPALTVTSSYHVGSSDASGSPVEFARRFDSMQVEEWKESGDD